MIEAKLAKLDGTELVFHLPENCSEIKLRAKLDFDAACIKMFKYMSEIGEEFSSAYYLYLLASTLTEFFTAQNTPAEAKNPDKYKLDFAAFHAVDVSELVDEKGELLESVINSHVELFNKAKKVDLERSTFNLNKIFEYLYSILGSYEFNDTQTDYSFTYKNEKYTVFAKYRDAILGIQKYTKVSLGELTEAFEVTRHAQKLMSNDKNDKASVMLTEQLHLLAILARKEGEKFPSENTEEWIAARARHFFDIPLQNSSDVFFYLTHSLSHSQKEQIVNTFLIHLNHSISTIQANTSKNKSQKTKQSGKEQALTA